MKMLITFTDAAGNEAGSIEADVWHDLTALSATAFINRYMYPAVCCLRHRALAGQLGPRILREQVADRIEDITSRFGQAIGVEAWHHSVCACGVGFAGSGAEANVARDAFTAHVAQCPRFKAYKADPTSFAPTAQVSENPRTD